MAWPAEGTVKHEPFRLWRDGVTQGLLADFLECRQKCMYRMMGFEPAGETSKALVVGSAIHDALEKARRRLRPGAVLSDGEAEGIVSALEVVEAAEGRVTEHSAYAWTLAWALLQPYFQFYCVDDRKIEWVELEGEFCVEQDVFPYANFCFRGKFDGVFRSRGSKLWLLETKTRSIVDGEGLSESVGFNHQVMFYLNALKMMSGEMPGGVLYDVIKKPALRVKKSETLQEFGCRVRRDATENPDKYFFRFEVPVDAGAMAIYRLELRGLLEDFVLWYEEGCWPHYRRTAACLGKFGRCKYLRMCDTGSSDGYTRKKQFKYEELGG